MRRSSGGGLPTRPRHACTGTTSRTTSPMPSATFSRWHRRTILNGREDEKEGERGHESVTQGLFQSRRRSVRHYHGVRAVLTVGGAGRRARSRLEAREHGGVHEHLLLLLRRLRRDLLHPRRRADQHRRRSRPSGQPGRSVPEGRHDVPAAQRGGSRHARGDQEPEPQDPSDGSTPRRLRVGGYHLDDAVAEIARWVKDTRDATFETVSNGITVNRCHGIASLGGSSRTPRKSTSSTR